MFDATLQQLSTDSGDSPAGWAEYAAVMRSYRTWKTGDRLEARRIAATASGILARALDDWYDRLDERTGVAVRTAP
jgi:thymidylate synthase